MPLNQGQILQGRHTYEVVQFPEYQPAAATGLARMQETGQLVMVKMLGAEAGFLFTPRFELAVARLGEIQSPNIVCVRDFGAADDEAFVILDYYEGEPLHSILDGAQPYGLDQELAFYYTGQMVETLIQTHRSGLVHGEIKPGNIVVTPADNILILGFGLTLAPGFSTFSALDLSDTLPYIAPELLEIRASTVDVRADIYSTGAVVYEMLCGHPPFNGATLRDFLHMVFTGSRPLASSYNSAIAPAIDAFLMRCLAFKPAARFQTPDEMLAAFQSLQQAGRSRPSAMLVNTKGQTYEIPDKGGVLGRADPQRNSKVAIDLSNEEYGRTVSRNQARIRKVQGQWTISTYANVVNATTLNGHVLESDQKYALQDHDEIRIGGVKLVFKLPGA
jgi:eukaryotic-like serine/threonine-protein kinase